MRNLHLSENPNQRPRRNYTHHIQHHRIGITLFVFALVGIVGALAGGVGNSTFTLAARAISPNENIHYLRAIGHHKIHAVCSKAQPNHASCLLEETLASNGQPLNGEAATVEGDGPTQFHTAYDLPCTPGGPVQAVCSTPGSFGPETIAIVDAGNFASGASGLASSLQTYDQYFNLPACTTANGCLNIVSQTGSTSSLPGEVSSQWSDEIALDVETAHMVCQTCKIVLVEANDSSTTNLAAAEEEATTFDPLSISNSWGSSEDETSYDSDFVHPGIAVVAATGDTGTIGGSGDDWPADNPDVVAVSGTSLVLNEDNTWSSETVWSDSGGGCSANYSAPSWQSSLSSWAANGCGSHRALGDVSADADPNTGAAVYTSSWFEFGGTSLAAPIIAGVFALTGGLPSSATAPTIPYAATYSTNFHDVTSGSDCSSGITEDCTAAVGFDTPSGLGSPNGLGGFISLPSTPTNLTTTFVSSTSLHLSWTASSGTYGISGYHVYRNGIEIGTTSTPSYTDSGLTANEIYSYDVVAYDSIGDLSNASAVTAGSTFLPEDINEDEHVDLLDLSLLANKYGQTGTGVGRADINSDGIVNLLDLSLLANKYGSE